MKPICVRPMTQQDRSEVAELIYISLNHWYQMHGRPPVFTGGPRAADVFYQVYSALEPGCAIVAENPETGRLMGSCFYHPRPHHVGLGIMNVHPNYFGAGAGRALLGHITDLADAQGKPVRLTQSALNLDSFSLYTRAGFVPRCAFQDMLVPAPAQGMNIPVPGRDRVRDAAPDDVPAMAALEWEVSGITREQDYRFCIRNETGFWHASVYEGPRGIDGFMLSSGHSALNMLGPCVARSEREAAALVAVEMGFYRGRSPVAVIPVECENLVRHMYEWGARNCELHFCQVRGRFQPFRGVSMPSYLPETA